MNSTLTLLLLVASLSSASAVTVLTNFPGPVTTTNGVKGTGGAIPVPIAYGFEFTVGGGDHDLVTMSFDIGTHLGSLPLTVELMNSPAGPDTATLLTALSGPPQPANQVATYVPASAVTLTDGDTYFVRFTVIGNASSYGINRTSTAATGTWTMGNLFTRAGSGTWSPGGFSPETMVEIIATPVPEPAAVMLGCAGFLLILRRRRW